VHSKLSYHHRMFRTTRSGAGAITLLSTSIILPTLIYLARHNLTYVHIDAIAHVNKARGLWDNTTPGLKQLGSIWLPLQHILMAPLTTSDVLWSTGLAGSLLSAACFVGTAYFVFGATLRWTGSRVAGWFAFLFFALNPHIVYLFSTPMTEPLMVVCAAGLMYYLVEWIQSASWYSFAMACLMVFGGTLTRYEGWAIAAAAIPVVLIAAPNRRWTSAVLFTGAAVVGPMLWMIYNLVYFDDPLMFAFGRGSAWDYAQEYFLRTGKHFPTAGSWIESLRTYWTDVAYCVNPVILWLSVLGASVGWLMWRKRDWRIALIVTVFAVGSFLFYSYNLYTNMVPVMLPGLVKDEPGTIYNVRYGMVMVATVPVLAAFLMDVFFRMAEQRRFFAFLLIGFMFLPDPVPDAGEEAAPEQLTKNLLYTEGVHNQSFWMPPFVNAGRHLKSEIEATHDETSFVLTNSRILHPVVWATGIHMKRFINEMNKERWTANLNSIDPGIRWVITEEGDQLWNCEGKTLKTDWIEVAHDKTESTGVVHLYRRR